MNICGWVHVQDNLYTRNRDGLNVTAKRKKHIIKRPILIRRIIASPILFHQKIKQNKKFIIFN